MNLEFKIYELKESSRYYNILIKDKNQSNEFIVIGEETDYYRACQIDGRGLCLIPGVSLGTFTLQIPKNDLQLKQSWGAFEIKEFEIPKKYLDINTVEDIKRLND